MDRSPRLVHLNRFLELAASSQLLEPKVLDDAVAEFRSGARAPSSPGSDVVGLCDFLVWRRLLTRWHCEMLLKENYRGFYFGKFKFLDVLDANGRDDRILAEDTTNRQLVLLAFPERETDLGGTVCKVLTVGTVDGELTSPDVRDDLARAVDQLYLHAESRYHFADGDQQDSKRETGAMADQRIQTFAEFWPFYVREHAVPACRALHFIGSTLSLVVIAAGIVYNPWILLAAPIVGYGFAWFGHFFIEKNKPASFKYPLWSFLADWKMWAMILAGRMGSEVQRTTTAGRS